MSPVCILSCLVSPRSTQSPHNIQLLALIVKVSWLPVCALPPITHSHRCLCEDTDRCLGCCEPLYVNVWLCGPGSRSGLGPDVCLSVCSFVHIRICISGVMPLNAWNKPLPPRLCVLQINESYLQWQIFENVIQRSCPRRRPEAGSLGVIIPLVPIILSIYICVHIV